MGREQCWKGNISRTTLYLMSCTLVIMFVMITVEYFIFNPTCKDSECKSSQGNSVVKEIGRVRSLVKPSVTDPQLQSSAEKSRRSESTSNAQPEFESENRDELLKTRWNSGLDTKEDPNLLDGEFDKRDEASVVGDKSFSPPPVQSAWYYTKVYKHPEVKLRLLTADDGAPRIQTKTPLPERTITIVTQTSPDRLPALQRICMTWGGALCIAVYVRLESEIADVYGQLKQMYSELEQNGRCWVDLQMVIEDSFQTKSEARQASFPLNAVRNVALSMATTTLVFLLDADFHPSHKLHESLTENAKFYQDLLTKATHEKQLFVVAAFEAASSEGRRTAVGVPETMEDLRAGWENDTVTCFHCKQSPTGHMPTNFTRFFDPATKDPYTIPYRDGYEPYVIGALDVIPLYDTRFRGYGEDKVSHIYYCAAKGMGLRVLPNAFIFEMHHPPSDDRKIFVGKQRDQNRRNSIIGLYRQFKMEVEREQMVKDPVRFRQFLQSLKKFL